LRAEDKLKVSENEVIMNKCGPKWDEVSGHCRWSFAKHTGRRV